MLHLLLILLKLEVIIVRVITVIRVPIIVHSHTAETYVRVVVTVYTAVVEIPALLVVPISVFIVVTVLLHPTFPFPLLLLLSS